GAELTGLSGFTGVSTIGGPTSLLTTGQYASDDEHSESLEQPHGLAPTPLRKRLSMAAKDFGNMTPRFPKSLPTEDDQGDVHSSPDDDDDDDVEDEDDGDEPCTENIGEFADLDSQMNELEMQLGTKFKSRHDDGSPFRAVNITASSAASFAWNEHTDVSELALVTEPLRCFKRLRARAPPSLSTVFRTSDPHTSAAVGIKHLAGRSDLGTTYTQSQLLMP
ncbi:hypothetical protein GGI24_002363, partial [Coemansia furcata]